MSELRWILLVAGIALVVGLYAWGMRSRRRPGAASAERPARFEATAEPTPESAADADLEVPTSAVARLEPSFSVADDVPDDDEDGHEAGIAFDEPPATRSAPGARREPTLGPPVEPTRIAEPQRSIESRLQEARTAQAAPAPARPQVQSPPPAAGGGTSDTASRQKIVALRVVASGPIRFEGAKLLEAIKSEGLEFGRYDIFHRLHDDGRPIFSLASLREPGTFDTAAMPMTTYPGVALFGVLPGPVSATELFDDLIFTARALAALLGGTLADERGAPLTVHRITRLRDEMLAFEQEGSAAADS